MSIQSQRSIVIALLLASGAGCSSERASQHDGAVLWIDGGPTLDGRQGLPDLTGASEGLDFDGGNSGQICAAREPSCPVENEICLLFERGATRGMCLGPCERQGDPCPVADPTTMNSICIFGVQGGSSSFCGYLCEVEGKSFACPNGQDYSCEPLYSSMPEVRFCLPR